MVDDDGDSPLPPSPGRRGDPSARRDIGFPLPSELLYLFPIRVCENGPGEIGGGRRLRDVADGFALGQSEPLRFEDGFGP